MLVAVLGATGRTGREIVEAALARGHAVRALARDPAALPRRPEIEIVQGDAFDSGAIRALLSGVDAAISAIGPTGASKAEARRMISSTSTANVLREAGAMRGNRYVALTSASLRMSTDRRNFYGLVTRFAGPFVLGPILRDKIAELRLLERSSLDWTLVRAPEIVAVPPSGRVDVRVDTHRSMKVSCADVAGVLIDEAGRPGSARGLFVSVDMEAVHREVTSRRRPA
jgi:putative NADH-flavin reductase